MIKVVATGEMHSMEVSAAAVALTQGADRLASLFHEHADFVWRAVRRFGLDRAEADDATQQVFLVASRKLGRIPIDGERSFLFATAANIAKTLMRSRLRKREDAGAGIDLADARPNPEERLERQRACDAVDRILASMPEDLRLAFILFEIEEMTAIEVAKCLDIPAGTVASRVRRAREIFRAAAKGASTP